MRHGCPGWERIQVNSGPLRGEWVRPQLAHARPEDPTLLYLHGGGYVSGTVATHRSLVTAIALTAGMRAFSLEYRRAPEYPFPVAVNDAEGAYRALLDHGILAARLVLVGDSAGGGLALATVLAAREHGLALPAGLWLISPLTDQAATGNSLQENDRRDAMFYGDSIRHLATIYLQGAPATDPLASPLYADLAGVPPLCIHASDSEILRDDAIRLAARAQGAGVKVSLRLWHAVPHVWQFLLGFLPEAHESVAAGARFLRARRLGKCLRVASRRGAGHRVRFLHALCASCRQKPHVRVESAEEPQPAPSPKSWPTYYGSMLTKQEGATPHASHSSY